MSSITIRRDSFTMTCGETSISDHIAHYAYYFEAIMRKETELLLEYAAVALRKIMMNKVCEAGYITFKDAHNHILSVCFIFDKLVECMNFLLSYRKLFFGDSRKQESQKQGDTSEIHREKAISMIDNAFNIDQEYKHEIFEKYYNLLKNSHTNIVKILFSQGRIVDRISDQYFLFFTDEKPEMIMCQQV